MGLKTLACSFYGNVRVGLKNKSMKNMVKLMVCIHLCCDYINITKFKAFVQCEYFKRHIVTVEMICIVFVLVEMSDQNFVDEDIKVEKASNTYGSKRMKTRTTDASSSDQVMSKFD